MSGQRQRVDVGVAGDVEYLARWWTSASQAQRFEALKRSIEENRPELATLRLAIIASEIEAGEVGEG